MFGEEKVLGEIDHKHLVGGPTNESDATKRIFCAFSGTEKSLNGESFAVL
jgi:hypothetical protein